MRTAHAPIRRLLALAAIVAVVTSACATAASPTPAPTAAPATVAPATVAPATVAPATEAPSASAPAAACTTDRTDNIKVGHLNYYTGEFADVGPWFQAITMFSVDLVNQDPPLGRKLEVLDGDIGTVGEAAVSRRFVDNDKVEVLLNVAHNYLSYRDWMLSQIKANKFPAMPTVHGGGIPPQYGGTVEEPIMRAAPQDTGQASAALLHAAKDLGAKKVALLATQVSGSQLQKEQAVVAAKELGLEVVETLDIATKAPSYRAEINKIAGASPDAVILFSQAEDGGTFVKQAAEAGNSWNIIGTTEWLGAAFPATATMGAIAQHKAVLISGFSYVDGPAWNYYKPLEQAYAATAAGEALKPYAPEMSYLIEYYDILTLTSLAIQKACSTETDKWLPAMRAVAMAPGTKCYNYAECLALIKAGTDVDYSGVTGEMDYTDTGVVSGTYGIFKWTSLDSTEQVTVLDGTAVLALEKVGQEAGVGQ